MSSFIVSVHQLNEYVRDLLHRDPMLRAIKVRGELSNFKQHSSGHMYFSLKDEQDLIRCVFFKQNHAGLNFQPRDGIKVVVKGSVSLFSRDGQYQFYVDSIEKDGMGALHLAFEALKNKLKNEGLFDPSLKKTLPLFPEKIAVVTSHTGAVVRDIIKVAKRRNRLVHILVIPVAVQGTEAHGQITRAIDYINTRKDIDVIILGRGGGSIEDLWPFNEEDVARAIFRSEIPIISAVGHETDFTIADFVSDIRAATPSVAAEIAVPDVIHLSAQIRNLERELLKSMDRLIMTKQQRTDNFINHYVFKTPQLMLNQYCQYADQLSQRLLAACKTSVQSKTDRLAKTAASLQALSPLHVLSRGYAVTFLADSEQPVYSLHQIAPKSRVRILWKDGQAVCTIDTVEFNEEKVALKENDQ